MIHQQAEDDLAHLSFTREGNYGCVLKIGELHKLKFQGGRMDLHLIPSFPGGEKSISTSLIKLYNNLIYISTDANFYFTSVLSLWLCYSLYAFVTVLFCYGQTDRQTDRQTKLFFF